MYNINFLQLFSCYGISLNKSIHCIALYVFVGTYCTMCVCVCVCVYMCAVALFVSIGLKVLIERYVVIVFNGI